METGSIPRTCPQAAPAWELTAVQFIPQYLAGSANIQFNSSTPNAKRAAELTEAQLAAAELQEDCLFLDVFTPKKVFDSDGRGAPVLGMFSTIFPKIILTNRDYSLDSRRWLRGRQQSQQRRSSRFNQTQQ